MPARIEGIFVPIITPFLNGEVDYESYKLLLESLVAANVSGVVPLATTGEIPTVEDDEYVRLLEESIEVVRGRTAVFAGISSNSTRKAVRIIKKLDTYAVDGYLVTAPYYNLPSQGGIYDHFAQVSGSTDKRVLIYNIPYRTGRNVENETILRLSRLRNVVGIKDSCGNINQTIELIRDRDEDFSVLTGEDILFYFNVASGGDGGILASAHLNTGAFVDIFRKLRLNDHHAALALWNRISPIIPLLFREPNPAPIKYLLARKGMIKSEEVRGPLAGISQSLRTALDRLIDTGVV